MPSQQSQPAGTSQRPQPDQLAGLVERVTFHSDESGYCVLRIKARGHRDLVTVVGTLPEVRAGEWLEAQGRWIVNKEYGRQFQADTRSRKLVVLVGTLKALAIAVRNMDARRRVTLLKQRLGAIDGGSALIW